MAAKANGWQKAAWVVGFLVAATSVGLIPRLTDLQTVAAASAEHERLEETIDRVHKECQDQHKETVQLLHQIIQKLR